MQQLDTRLYAHSVDTCVLSLIVGAAKGYLVDQLEILGLTALLHDVGLMRLPQNLLRKQTPLTPQERQIFQTHPQLGETILNESPDLDPDIRLSVSQHHERINGSGYPAGLISPVPLAQIVGICDVYSELVTGHGDEPTHTPSLALRRIVTFGEEGLFDPILVELIIQALKLDQYKELYEEQPTEPQVVDTETIPVATQIEPSGPEPEPPTILVPDSIAEELGEEQEEETAEELEEYPAIEGITVASLLEGLY